MSDYDYLFKVVLLGDAGTGKSSLLARYTRNEFSRSSKSTIGVEFATKTVVLNEKRVKGQIWDTAGQDRFRAVCDAYYQGAYGAILVYDISKRSSFENLDKWLDEVKRYADANISLLVAGNKCDLSYARAVSVEEGMKWTEEHNCSFIETSALDATNVEEAFLNVLWNVYEKHSNGAYESEDEGITIDTNEGEEIALNNDEPPCTC
ncbi:hypothetical protein PCE1_001124 [Barthelona sp. PCE]